jgi:aspartyl aminopeptidase
MKSKYMDCQKIIKTLKHKDFIKISNNGKWFEDGAAVYAKEIKIIFFYYLSFLKI